MLYYNTVVDESSATATQYRDFTMPGVGGWVYIKYIILDGRGQTQCICLHSIIIMYTRNIENTHRYDMMANVTPAMDIFSLSQGRRRWSCKHFILFFVSFDSTPS